MLRIIDLSVCPDILAPISGIMRGGIIFVVQEFHSEYQGGEYEELGPNGIDMPGLLGGLMEIRGFRRDGWRGEWTTVPEGQGES